MSNYFLEGAPGVGKTTLLRTIAGGIGSLRIGGFYTREIREKGQRIGFEIETFSGLSGVLAHSRYKTGPRVGKYRVDVAAFEEIGVNGLEKALADSDLILIDEIGKMELCSARFQASVISCLDSAKPVIATVMLRSHPFVDRLKARPDVRLLKVTLENRNELAGQLIREAGWINTGG